MRPEIEKLIEDIETRIARAEATGGERAARRIAEIDASAQAPDFWSDPAAARARLKERRRLERRLDTHRRLAADLSDAATLIELGEAEGDAATVAEGEAALNALARPAAQAEIAAGFDGAHDSGRAFLSVQAVSPRDPDRLCDWSGRLARMYRLWAHRRGFRAAPLLDEHDGFGSARFFCHVSGDDAYG